MTWEDEYAVVEKRIQIRIDKAKNELAPAIDTFRKGAVAYISSGRTAVDWDTLVKQHGRSVSNGLPMLDGYKEKLWKKFELFKGFDIGALKIRTNDDTDKSKRLLLLKAAQKMVEEIAVFTPN